MPACLSVALPLSASLCLSLFISLSRSTSPPPPLHVFPRLLTPAHSQVATPYFDSSSTSFVVSATLHIQCDTEGSTIRYTVDGTDPAGGGDGGGGGDTGGSPSALEVAPGESVLVDDIGTITIRAVAWKEGMTESDEISKTVTVQVYHGTVGNPV